MCWSSDHRAAGGNAGRSMPHARTRWCHRCATEASLWSKGSRAGAPRPAAWGHASAWLEALSDPEREVSCLSCPGRAAPLCRRPAADDLCAPERRRSGSRGLVCRSASGRPAALALLRSGELATLELALYETVNVAIVRWEDLDAADRLAARIWAIAEFGTLVRVDRRLGTEVAQLATEHGSSAYDAGDVAAARRLAVTLASCDERDLVRPGLIWRCACQGGRSKVRRERLSRAKRRVVSGGRDVGLGDGVAALICGDFGYPMAPLLLPPVHCSRNERGPLGAAHRPIARAGRCVGRASRPPEPGAAAWREEARQGAVAAAHRQQDSSRATVMMVTFCGLPRVRMLV